MLIAASFFAPAVAHATIHPDWVDHLELSAGKSLLSGKESPFWMWSNQDGRIPKEGNTAFNRLQFSRNVNDENDLDWMYGVDITARSNAEPKTLWTDAWAGAVYRNLRLTIGRKSETFGLADSLLTAGPEVYSRNAPTIPKIALSTKGYVGLNDWLSVNAYLAHGWMGTAQYLPDAYLHEKFLYFRFGDTWPDEGINFFSGIHDLAVWGGEGNPSGIKDYLDVFLGRKGGSDSALPDQQNALGDHRGVIEFAFQTKGYDRDWYLYAQSMYEDQSGLKFWDPGDCLIGGSLIIKNQDSHIARINLEYLDTRKTSGNKLEPDNYFTNWAYSGWAHDGYAIGHPFIRFVEGPNNAWEPQNRIKAVNGAIQLRYGELMNPLFRIAWIRNSGSFSVPLSGEQKTTVIACDFSNTMHIVKKWSFSQQISLDMGNKSESNLGFLISITKSWF
jgi:hypothetical protein